MQHFIAMFEDYSLLFLAQRGPTSIDSWFRSMFKISHSPIQTQNAKGYQSQLLGKPRPSSTSAFGPEHRIML